MPALSDRSFNPQAWGKLGLYAIGLGIVAVLVWASSIAFEKFVENPRLLEKRFNDPVGRAGMTSSRISHLGAEAVPTLVGDMKTGTPAQRSKSLELLSGIDDSRVVPTLAGALLDGDVGVRLTALAGLGRTGKPEAAKQLWPLTQSDDDLLRLRAIVALGLCGGQEDIAKLVAAALATTGQERALFAWSAGRVQRRLASLKLNADKPEIAGYVAPAPDYTNDEQIHARQVDIDVLLADIEAGKDMAQNGLKLNELTDVGFATWNQGHQIAIQVLAVRGPEKALASGGDALPMEPAKPTAQKLQMDAKVPQPVP
jgi:hypothetical protein